MKKIFQSTALSIFALVTFACNSAVQPWPDGRIPFVPIGLESDELKIVIESMAEWEIASGGAVHFTLTDQVGDGVLHIMFTELDDNVCGAASVGFRPGKPAYLFLNAKYFTLYSEIFDVNVITTHELGHVIGLDDDPNDLMSIMFPVLFENSTGKQISPSDAESVRTMYELQ